VKAGVKIAALCPLPDALPLVEETMRTAYMSQGKPEEFDIEAIRFFSGQSAYMTGTLGYLQGRSRLPPYWWVASTTSP
jgi:hypothetical protein